jgi:asparagine synthase (glutamine-hydrolysing)
VCGIAGIFDTQGAREVSRDLLDRMNESQHHRGPDEGGLHIEPGVGLAHRRLSIYLQDSSRCLMKIRL